MQEPPANVADPLGLADRVLYRDGLVLVIDKPAGVAVHRSGRGGRVLEDGFGALRFGLPNPPGLAHRLDKDTAGCLVLGRHRKALALLGELFATGAVEKTYWAVVVGAPPTEEGVVSVPLAKRVSGNGWFMAVDPAGQVATTRYRTLGRGAGLTWLELSPETGRTHQLRVHCAHLGAPMLGDPIYGRAAANGPRLHLGPRRRAAAVAQQATRRGGRAGARAHACRPRRLRRVAFRRRAVGGAPKKSAGRLPGGGIGRRPAGPDEREASPGRRVFAAPGEGARKVLP